MAFVLTFPDCVIDLDRYEVRRGATRHALTPREVALLAHLAARRGEVVPRAEVLQAVWGYHPASTSQAVAVAVRRLRAKLEVDPAEPRILLTVARAGWKLQGAAQAPADVPTHEAPFVGRHAELAAIAAGLDGTRLVTLVGLGGSGKTRLAREFARHRLKTGGAVVFCGLAEATDEDHALRELASALDLDGVDEPRVIAALTARAPLVLILDNLEQVDRAAELTGRLHAVPEVGVVATSRVPLGLPDECLVRVGALDPEAALELFTVHALRADPSFRLDPVRDEVGALIAGLDRFCLALELAAARLAVLSVTELAAQLATAAGRVLRGRRGRHSALDETIRWSIALLSPAQRGALGELSVFRGGFTSAVAEAVTSPDLDAWWVDIAQALVQASLVVREGDRFHLLESIRRHATGLLGDGDAVVERHWRAFAALAESGTDLAPELDNLIAAAERAAAGGDGDSACRCYAAASGTLLARGALRPVIALGRVVLGANASDPARIGALVRLATAEGQAGDREAALRLLREAVDRAEGTGLAPEALLHLGDLHRERGEPELATRHLERALAVASPDEVVLRGQIEGRLGLLLRERGDVDGCLAHLERALVLHRRGGDRLGEGMACLHRGIALKERGRFVEARLDLDEALACFTEVGDRRYEAVATQELGVLARHEGQLDQAAALLRDALDQHRRMGLRRNEAMVLGNLANVLKDQERFEEALRAYRRSLAIKEEIGETVFRWVALGNLGELLLELGRPAEAEPNLRRALEQARGVGHRLAVGAFSIGLGAALFELGHHEQGRALLGEGEAIMDDLGQPIERVKAMCRRGEMELADGNLRGAADILARAREAVHAGGWGERTPGARAVERLRRRLEAAGPARGL